MTSQKPATKKTLEELITILQSNYCDENINEKKRKPRVYLAHLTDDERAEYKKEWSRLISRKYWLKNKDDNGVNTQKKNYYETVIKLKPEDSPSKTLSRMKSSYRYYNKQNRRDVFIKRYPEYYRQLIEVNYITE